MGNRRWWLPSINLRSLLVTGSLAIFLLLGIEIIYQRSCTKPRFMEEDILTVKERHYKWKLPPTVVPPSAWVTYSKTWQGYPLPVITSLPLGRLGNIMGQYATLYALSRLYNVSAVVHPRMKKLVSHFPNISLPNLPGVYKEKEWEKVQYIGHMYNYARIELAATGLLGPRQFVMTGFPFEIQLFNKVKESVRKEFIFGPEYITATLFGATLPDLSYFDRALQYYRDKFPGKALFVVASDDMKFAKSKLEHNEDVNFAPGTSKEIDMAVLTSCNHSIITMGSFGFWTAFLAGGEVVYPDVKYMKEYRFSRKMYEMIGMKSFTPLPVN